MALPCEMLLHPEFLSNEQLIIIIQERQLRMPNVENLPRDELLEIFHSFCVPYGQRKYRDSGRGKMLNKNRPGSPELKPKLYSQYENSNQSRKSSYPWPNDRLKPPPEMMSGQPKKIKLDAKLSAAFNGNNEISKRKLSIEDEIPATDSPPTKKARKPITWP